MVYTPYAYEPSSNSDVRVERSPTGDLLGVPELDPSMSPAKKKRSKFHAVPNEAEIFVFGYGTVVIWGMTEPQEKRFLASMYVRIFFFFGHPGHDLLDDDSR